MMSNDLFDYTIQLENINNIPFHKYEKDFNFIVNGKKYQTSRIIADILSPFVRKLHYIDEAISEFEINIKDSPKDDEFEDFLNLSRIEIHHLTPEQQEQYSLYFYKLGNIEEYFRIRPENAFVPLSPKNAISRLETVLKLTNDSTYDIETEIINSIEEIISYIANHFEEINKSDIKKLPIDIIDKILNDDSLKLFDEDSILDFVLSLYDHDEKYIVLFEYIYFNNISDKAFEYFINRIDITSINRKIWESIKCRFEIDTNRNSKNRKYMKDEKEFRLERGKEFDGIMHYLTNISGGNIHDNGTIEITTNSIADDNFSFHPKYLVDYKLNTFYESKNEKDVFICFDFKDKLVQVRNYTIKSHKDGFNRGNLRNWIVEVSNDSENWLEIDRHENDSSLNRSNYVANFSVAVNNNRFYRFVRIKQIGASWHGYPNFSNYYIYFYFIEFFGKLRMKSLQ